MKLLSILLLLSFSLFAAEEVQVDDKTKVTLESLSKHAIRIGTGTSNDVYVFVDPLCKFSKKLITKLNENKMLHIENSYYIFLYRLPRLDSEKLMQYIYQSDDPKSTLLDVMVDGEVIDLDDFEVKQETLKALEEIAKVAKTLDMKLRPYMISFEKDSKFCRVSEGSASCLDEFE